MQPSWQGIYIDICVMWQMMQCVRKWCSLLLMLAFLTAYGRCVADQLGILHTSGTSCCVVICEEIEDSCQQCPDELSSDPGHPPIPEENEDPKPCQLCIIIDADGLVTGEEVRIPAPDVHDQQDDPDYSLLTGPFRGIDLTAAAPIDLRPSDNTDPPGERRAQLQRILCRVIPIRGPSIT
ncbi:MAG: hypothetical protein ACPHVK_09135 [Akkermansiaceae bacterium]